MTFKTKASITRFIKKYGKTRWLRELDRNMENKKVRMTGQMESNSYGVRTFNSSDFYHKQK